MEMQCESNASRLDKTYPDTLPILYIHFRPLKQEGPATFAAQVTGTLSLNQQASTVKYKISGFC